jgi:hypothetical protein
MFISLAVRRCPAFAAPTAPASVEGQALMLFLYDVLQDLPIQAEIRY